jgi:hypothetical protein
MEDQPGAAASGEAGDAFALMEDQPGAAASGEAGDAFALMEDQPAAASRGAVPDALPLIGDLRAAASRVAREAVSSHQVGTRPMRLPGGAPSLAMRRLAGRAARFGRQHRLEAASVGLMTLGGLIYPFPVWVLSFSLWLLGAIVAAASRQWSLWDKWAGLIGPVALIIAGASAGLALGGHRHSLADYVHEVMTDSRYMIPVAALLGAGYLAWRAHRGQRFRMPPWNRPHRV